MGAKFVIKRGDTAPAIRAELSMRGDGEIDFEGAAVVLVLRDEAGAVRRLDADLLEADGSTATVEYAWEAGDTDDEGAFDAEWEVTLADGNVMTFPNRNYFRVTVVADLRV